MNPLAEAGTSRTMVLGHDWLTGMRGGERVLELLCETFPDAPIATLLCNPESVSETIRRHPVVASWLGRIPGIHRHYRNWLPLMPWAARSLAVPPCDVLLTCSHCVSKAFRKPVGAKHLCYCFTPMRYAWTFREEYFGRNPLKGLALAPLLAALRVWDRKTASEVDRFVGISQHVADRIRRHYGRDCDVVYPPVDVARCTPAPDGRGGEGGFDLIVSALVPYKRVDLAVETYSRHAWPLKVVGVGGAAKALAAKAGPTVEFLGWKSDDDVLALYRQCRFLVFPGEEDFGIVPLEAQACGRPVVAFGCGGALETVREGETGVFFSQQTPEALAEAVEHAARQRWDPAAIRAHAETFGPARFLAGLGQSLSRLLATP